MSATAYVNFPQTYKKFSNLYEQTGRKKKIENEQFSKLVNLSTTSTNNYIYGGAQFGVIERVSTSSFKLTDDMIELMRLQKKYHHHLISVMLKDEIFRKVVINFGNKIPPRKKLARFLANYFGLPAPWTEKSHRAKLRLAIHNYYQNAEYLDDMGIYNFDDWDLLEDTIFQPDETAAASADDDAPSPGESRKHDTPYYSKQQHDPEDDPITPDAPPKPWSFKLRKPRQKKERGSDAADRVNNDSTYLEDIHFLSAADRSDLELLDREIAELSEWINYVESVYPERKRRLWEAQQARASLVLKAQRLKREARKH